MNAGSKKVLVYSTNTCPYCIRAKQLLEHAGIPFEEILVEAPEARQALIEKTGRRTVPQIFIGEYHVGGYDDLKVLYDSGKLSEIYTR